MSETHAKRAPNPRRGELVALSAELKPLVAAGAYESVNAALTAYYSKEVGCAEWRTFKGWRDAGRPVRKGERGFPVWGQPKRLKGEAGAGGGGLAELAELSGVEPQGPQWFPVAYIFHAGQVEAVEVEAAQSLELAL
jgi:hypothetical protein